MQIERFVRGKLEVCRWVGLAVLLVQLISLGLAYMVSSAQQRVLEARCSPSPELRALLQVACNEWVMAFPHQQMRPCAQHTQERQHATAACTGWCGKPKTVWMSLGSQLHLLRATSTVGLRWQLELTSSPPRLGGACCAAELLCLFQRALRPVCSNDEDDEVWGRRMPLLARYCSIPSPPWSF